MSQKWREESPNANTNRVFENEKMDLIGLTLELLRSKLNQYFNNLYLDNDERVIISNIVRQDGSLYEDAKDKLVIFLANMQMETIISTFSKDKPVEGNKYVSVTPPLYLNLYLLFYANYSDANYRNGLTMISGAISFFQQNPVFTQNRLPGLDDSIDKLTFEMVNMDMAEHNYLMGLAGAKYLPSVLYKVRMLPFIGQTIQGQTPAVKGLQNHGDPDDGDAPTPKMVQSSGKVDHEIN